MQLFNRVLLAVQNAQFRRWQRRNPGATFKDYFATLVRDQVKNGHVHPTLGGNLRDGDFGEFGKNAFKRLLKLGLTPEDSCVDYGCGTLRIGVHAIRYLAPGRYWGLDIDQTLLDTGAELIGKELMQEKRPELRIIAPDTVKEAAAAKPALLYSTAVMIHVHPDELEEYFGNILTIIGPSGTAIITGKWSAEGMQYSRKSWAHSLSSMRSMVDQLGGRLSVVKEEERDASCPTAKGGTLELRAKVQSIALVAAMLATALFDGAAALGVGAAILC
jgi:hypothetical protein